MGLSRNVVVDHPEVARLENLHGIRMDLEWVEQLMWTAARIWQGMMIRRSADLHAVLRDPDSEVPAVSVGSTPVVPIDSLLLEAVCTATIVRYTRCFKGGVRSPLPTAWIQGLNNQLQDHHTYLLQLRDKHVAHSVNPYEYNRVTAVVPAELPDGWSLAGLGYSHARHGVMFSYEEIELFAELAGELKVRVQQEIREEERRVLPILESLPRDEIRRWEMCELGGTPRDAVGEPRKRRGGRQ